MNRIIISRKTRRWMATFTGPDRQWLRRMIGTPDLRIKISARLTTEQVRAHMEAQNPWSQIEVQQ